eukprot:159701-Chlamydomonas_euryale.AAC.5
MRADRGERRARFAGWSNCWCGGKSIWRPPTAHEDVRTGMADACGTCVHGAQHGAPPASTENRRVCSTAPRHGVEEHAVAAAVPAEGGHSAGQTGPRAERNNQLHSAWRLPRHRRIAHAQLHASVAAR